ncbi:MAG: mitochondrial fission ELM1 family protein, partial [Alphaproteobacteria bacterium]|nr:mitochondrial fission ELM1 family protein [Alphaproteobacteria bacterium]
PSATSHGGAPSTTSHGGAPSTTSHGGAQPDIAIFCGRRSAPYAALFHRSGVYTVFLGRPPRYYHSQLDLVIPSWHDGMQAQGITPNGNGHPPTGATRLVVARPEATRPVATRLGAARPVATRPEATRPVATRPEAARPVATRLVAVQPIVMPQLFSMHGLHVAAQPFASHDHAITLRKETTMLFVLIGGTSKHSTYSPPICDLVMNKLTLLIEQGWTLSVSASRRTPAALRQRLAALPPPHQYWEPSRAKSKKNPYPKAVTEAAAVVVTTDSVSMISESVAAEQPTYLIEIPTRSKRLDHFVKRVIAEQYAHPLRDGINMPPLATRAQNDTQTVAAWIARQLRAPDAS